MKRKAIHKAATLSDKIKQLMIFRNTDISALSLKTGISCQLLQEKFKSNDFTTAELRAIAAALGYELSVTFSPDAWGLNVRFIDPALSVFSTKKEI